MTIKRVIQSWVVYLKEELKLYKTCKNARNNLIKTLTKSGYFSDEISGFFTKVPHLIPIPISEDDPTQIAEYKKIINSLYNAEKAFKRFETLNVGQERYNFAILTDAIKAIYHGQSEIYSAIQLLNSVSPEVQSIMGSHFNLLYQKIAVISSGLKQLSPEHPEQVAAETIMDAIKHLPTEKGSENEGVTHLSELIVNLPNYFTELEKMMAKASLVATPIEVSEKENNQLKIKKKTRKIENQFKKVLHGNFLNLYSGYVASMKLLLAETSELINTATPITKDTYINAVAKLNEIRHKILPGIVTDLEIYEESIGLKPGTLTLPTIKKMENYYLQLATHINDIALAANVLDNTANVMTTRYAKIARQLAGDKKKIQNPSKTPPIVDLEILQDRVFMQTLRNNEANRLSEARLISEDQGKIDAANRFFAKLKSFSPVYHNWSMFNLSQADKRSLLTDYKLFQTHFATLYPDIDKLIIETLSSQSKGYSFSRVGNETYNLILGSNHFKQVINCQKLVLTDIHQRQAQNKLNSKIIEESIRHRDEDYTKLLGDSLDKLKRTREKLIQFIDIFENLSSDIVLEVNTLSRKKKEKLYRIYQEIKPYLLVSDQTLMDKLFEGSTPQDTSVTQRTVSRLSLDKIRHAGLNLIDQKIASLTRVISESVTMEQNLQSKELNVAPETAPKKIAEKSTIFTNLCQLNISDTLKNYTEKKLYPWLKSNLEPELLMKLSLDTKPLPLDESLEESSELLMYKNMINSIYYIQKYIGELERLKDYQDVSSLLTSTELTLGPLKAIIKYTVNVRFPLYNLVREPALRDIINEALEIIKPIEQVPLIGQYFTVTQSANTPTPPDIKQVWKSQQAIVRKGLGLPPLKENENPKKTSLQDQPEKPLKPSVASTPHEEKNANQVQQTLHMITQYLCEIPLKIKKLNPTLDKKLALNTEKMKMEADQFASQISKLYELYLSGTMDAYGPKALQSVLLICNELNNKLNDIGVTSQRFIYDNLKNLRSELGGTLIRLTDDAEFNLGLKPGTLSGPIFEKFEAYYKTFIANLDIPNIEDELRLLNNTELTERQINNEKKRLETLKSSQEAKSTEAIIFGEEGLFIKLKKLTHLDFSKTANQAMFLECFGELRKYLGLIDYQYTDFYYLYFLRELQTPEDFQLALKNIINDEGKFQQLIIGQSETQKLRIIRCQKRIQYSENQLSQEKEVIDQNKKDCHKTHTGRDQYSVFQNNLQNLIKNEQALHFLEPSPQREIRQQKITQLENLLLLNHLNFDNTQDNFNPDKAFLRIKQTDSYEKIITILNYLNEARLHIKNTEKKITPIIEAKLNAINILEKDLIEKNVPSESRIEKTLAYANSTQFQETMLKDDTHYFIKWLKRLFHISNKEEEILTDFRSQLKHIKEEASKQNINGTYDKPSSSSSSK